MRLILLAVLSCLGFVASMRAQTILLDKFDDGEATGSVLNGSSWVGKVGQNATSITIGAGAKDDNGWAWTGAAFDATGMNYILITAQRDTGHDAAAFFTIQFEDAQLDTQVFSVSTASFLEGSMSTVDIYLTAWAPEFDYTQITGWSIGGGTMPGLLDYRMTFDNLAFSATGSAIPEPGTYAAVFGLLTLGVVIVRRALRARQRQG